MEHKRFEWPPHVEYAVRKMAYEYASEEIAAFLKRWGGLERNNFIRALQEGQEDDRLLAFLAISYEDTPETHQLLLPFLESPHPKERWMSAFCLGTLRDERALPVLQTMLTEFLPPHVSYITLEGSQPYIDWFFQNRRPSIARLLGEWGRPDLIPTLVQALRELLHHEYAVGRRTVLGQAWRRSQNQIVYALGSLGTFELLQEFEVSEIRYRSWQVLFAMGAIHAHQGNPDLFRETLRRHPVLREQVKVALAERVGIISAEEQERCLFCYDEVLCEDVGLLTNLDW